MMERLDHDGCFFGIYKFSNKVLNGLIWHMVLILLSIVEYDNITFVIKILVTKCDELK